jgi:hypothetical protein
MVERTWFVHLSGEKIGFGGLGRWLYFVKSQRFVDDVFRVADPYKHASFFVSNTLRQWGYLVKWISVG